MDGTIIKLTTPVEAFNRRYTEVTLREPTGALFLRLGEPRIPVLSGESGGYYFVEQAPIINAYLEKLVSVDDNNDIAVTSAVLSQISLADAARIKEALFRFFTVAAAQAAAANPSPKL